MVYGFDYETTAAASSVASGLHGFKDVGGGEWKGNCPIPHPTGGNDSGDFAVWNDPASGRLRYYCGTHQCGVGNKVVDLQVRNAIGWPCHDGTRTRPRITDVKPHKPTPAERLWFDPQGVETVTELLDSPTWFAAIGKKGVGFYTQRGRTQWLHSSDRGNALDICRYGGELVRPKPPNWNVVEWTAYQETARRINAVNDAGIAWATVKDEPPIDPADVHPALSLSGSDKQPAVTPIGVLDVDVAKEYMPEICETRDRVCDMLASIGLPVFESSSGRGRHILWRCSDPGEWMRGSKVATHAAQGIVCEVFPAGYLRHVVLRPDNQIAGSDRIPTLTTTQMLSALTKVGFGVDTRWQYEER